MRIRARRILTVATATVGLVVLAACGPLRMGGPNNVVGIDPGGGGLQVGYWAAIQGPYSNHADGDPYDTKCARFAASATTCDAAGANLVYDPKGELFGVNVLTENLDAPVSVAIYDPAHGSAPDMHESMTNNWFSTSYELFAPSSPPGSNKPDPSLSLATLGTCTNGTPGSRVFAGGGVTFADAWYTLCTFTPTTAGTYMLQVKSSAIPGVVDQGGGWNEFSVRATATAGGQPAVYPLGTSSVAVAPQFSSTTSLYLGNFDQTAAGQHLVVDLFDPGDATSSASAYSVQVLAPPSGAPGLVPSGGSPVSCSYNSTPSPTYGPATPDTAPTCTVTTQMPNAGGLYNNSWLRLSIPLPTSYSCGSDCWWTLKFDYGNSGPVIDRVTWRVSLQ